MATKAEKVHAEEQKHGLTPRAKKRAKAKKTPAQKAAPHENKHAGAKASYALEAPSKTGRASRKSTRKSANRAKPDTNLTLREERRKRSPDTRARKAKARVSRVRGKAAAAATPRR